MSAARPSRLKQTRVQLVLPGQAHRELQRFLAERSAGGREAFAYVLCGGHRSPRGLRLLGRHFVFPEDDCFIERSAGLVRCHPDFEEVVMSLADRERLTLVGVHTHVADGEVQFSGVDDRAERNRAASIHAVLGDRVRLASAVANRSGRICQARLWGRDGRGGFHHVAMETVTGVAEQVPRVQSPAPEQYDRQVRSFGPEVQARLGAIQVGVVGLGGLGAIVVEYLSRLGVRKWVLVDPDRVETTNMNRLTAARARDAALGIPKVSVARRNIRTMHGRRARVQALASALPNATAERRLSECDLLVSATDGHGSRFLAQKIASAFLRPLVNVGVGLLAEAGRVRSMAVRTTAPPVGGPWCLSCGDVIDAIEAAKDLADDAHKALLKSRGYLPDTPAPAVYWLNGVAAGYAVQVLHRLLMPDGDGHREPHAEDLYVDMLAHEAIRFEHEGTGCPVCGADSAGGGLRGIGDAYFEEGLVEVGDLDLSAPPSDGTSESPAMRRTVATPAAETAIPNEVCGAKNGGGK